MSQQTGEKSEDPTPKKMRDARDKGQVANSKEVTSALIVGLLAIILFFGFDEIMDRLIKLMLAPANFYAMPFEKAAASMSVLAFEEYLNLSLPIVCLLAIAGIMGNYLQIGSLFSFDPVVPKFEKIDPVAGFKRIFCMKNFMEFIKSILKVVVIGIVCVFVVRDNLDDLLKIPVCQAECIPRVLGHLMFQLVGIVIVTFIIIAAADVAFQQHSHKKDLKMTKDEVKREHKDTDGNPEIKGRRRQIHKEILEGEGTTKAVKNSTVVVANPVDVAIAIHYEGGGTITPFVKAKGVAEKAKRIKALAREHGIPIMENVDLAQTLYTGSVELGFIQPDMFQPMIQVVIWLEEFRAERGMDALTSAL